MHILVATDLSTRSYRGLRRAGLLAGELGAKLTLLHVVDDDQPAALVELEEREVQRILQEQAVSVGELRGVESRPLVVRGDPFDGILRVAAEIAPTLIVMGVHRKQFLRDIFVGTTVERVLRSSSIPILVVSNEVSGPYTRAIAPIDLTLASVAALKVASRLRIIATAEVSTLHAFLSLARGKMSSAGLQQATIEEYVATESARAFANVREFIDANGMTDWGLDIQILEGAPFEAVQQAVEVADPPLLIIGTHNRTGLKKALLGSFTEDVLRRLQTDVLVVPPE